MLSVDVTKQMGNCRIEAAFSARGRKVTALYGPSGVGKTSIINMVAGLARPDRGRISMGEHCLFDREKSIDIPPHKRRVGYVFQEARLFPHMTVKSNLTYGMALLKASQRFVRLDQVVGLLGIEHLLDRRPARLSGGEKQRVAIGRALLCSPDILLMDEPLASLDAARKSEVLPFIQRLVTDFSVPVLYVSHAMDEIACLADEIVCLERGRVAYAGPLEGFRN